MAFNSLTYPYTTIVHITDTIGGQSFEASGVMISPDEVLTASHVVYTAGVGAASNISVTPAYNRGTMPFGSSSVGYYHYFGIDDASGLLSSATSQSDYAVLHLNTAFTVGTMGVQSNFAGGAVHVTGYPLSAGGGMIDTTETVSLDPTYSLLDGVDTGHGSSGGPVWIEGSGGPYVVGLVSSGNGVQGYNVQITSAVFNQIENWVHQDDYSNPLIDVAYYRAHNADVAAAPINSAYHYEVQGWKEGRDPSSYFADTGYLAANPDVAQGGTNPLDHYATYGWKEGRNPSMDFDTSLYLLHNPDVARAGIDPLLHYMTHGKAEGRATYAAIGPAMKFIFAFDPEYYLLANPDVARTGVDPWTHFSTYGWHEGRAADAFFDTKGYLLANPDVARSGMDPLLHYEGYGWKEGRNPSTTFDTKNYLATNPDVKASGMDPLLHYLQYGALEGRLSLGDGKFT